MGIETGTIVPCEEHGLPCERRVAFEGFETGRRFLACPLKVRFYTFYVFVLK